MGLRLLPKKIRELAAFCIQQKETKFKELFILLKLRRVKIVAEVHNLTPGFMAFISMSLGIACSRRALRWTFTRGKVCMALRMVQKDMRRFG